MANKWGCELFFDMEWPSYTSWYCTVGRLEADNQRLEVDRSHEIYVLQLEALEKTIGQQQRELKELNEQNRQQLEAFNQTKQDLQTKLDKVCSLGKLKEHALLSNV